MYGRVLWMRVRLETVGERTLQEPIWVDVYRSEIWEVIARDLPAFGLGRTPKEAWDAFGASLELLRQETIPQPYELPLECPAPRVLRKRRILNEEDGSE